MTELSSPIQFVKGVGPKLAEILKKKGISTIEDALYFIPRAYEDRSRITPIGSLTPKVSATILGRVTSARKTRKGRRTTLEVILSDETGSVVLFWFNAYPSLAEEFASGARFLVCGEARAYRGLLQIAHPDYEKVDGQKPPQSFHFGRVVPIYSETEGLHQKTIRKVMAEALKQSLELLDDPLPIPFRERLALPTLRDSFVSLHFPKVLPQEGELSAAGKRIVFEEFFVLQLGLGLKRAKLHQKKGRIFDDKDGVISRFVSELPFALTDDQKNAIAAIARDMKTGSAMTRLVQGDVGSGKTVVAFAAAALVGSHGGQTALMAPTEILAAQHFKNAQRWFSALGMPSALVVSANSSKKEVREAVSSGSAKVVIGTHALFQAGIEFKELGLVIVDEQHRFGVEQRNELVRKGTDLLPHLLMMTATPIPRTLAFTLYGDLDLTLIRQKPAHRLPIETKIIRERSRPQLFQKIRQTVARGEQVYVIYPLVEASEKLELKSATEMHQKISREVFPDLKVGLLHGRMKPDEKEAVLQEFKAGKYQILVSTTVVEVGIDVPNATLMVIEHPERLGLSQLHQLRGRVGRGSLKSECLLVVDAYVTPRLRVMEQTEDGFVIAEEDLKIRGPGEFLGTRQSGLPGFRVGHILRDAHLLEIAKAEADRLLSEDPELKAPENALLRKMVESRWKEKIDRLRG